MIKKSNNTKNDYRRNLWAPKGITLIALVVTIIVLLILAGIALNLTVGNNGLFIRAKSAKKQYEQAEIKEQLETQITSLIIDSKSAGKDLSMNEIANEIDKIGEVQTIEEDMIEGEYKDYSFTITEDGNVSVGEKITGIKPTAEINILTEGKGVDKVELQVIASTEEGEIASVEPINGAILKTENSVSDKIYEVTSNGVYKFRITGTNGRTAVSKKTVNSILVEMEAESIFEGLSRMNTGGLIAMKIKGKTSSGSEEEITYRLNVIHKDGNLELNAEETEEQIEELKTEGITLDKTNKIYSFGNQEDVGTASTYAQNTVVLKVNGNLTINEGVTATALGGSYGGPKGLIIYCTGTVTNSGTINMTARGAKAIGENVYLLKNKNTEGSFEYVPAIGAAGAGGRTSTPVNKLTGNTGGTGTNRQTGGGASGGAIAWRTDTRASSGSGSAGTSYSGGTGGGGGQTASNYPYNRSRISWSFQWRSRRSRRKCVSWSRKSFWWNRWTVSNIC